MREYKYAAPQSFEELFGMLEKLENEEVSFLAGGTDLIPKINREREEIPVEKKMPKVITYLGNLELNRIEENGDEVVIGAFCTMNQVQKNPLVQEKLPVLVRAIQETAGMSVRNTATLGGNIMNASPAADCVPALMVLNANLSLRSIRGVRTVNINDFFTGPGKTVADSDEILTTIQVQPGIGKASFAKLGRRKAETLSIVNAAAYVEAIDGKFDKIRIAIGSAAPTIVRCTALEADLAGKEITEENIKTSAERAVHEINPIDDVRATKWYRTKVTPVLAARVIKEAAGIGERG